MRVNQITLEGFRNIENICLQPCGGANIIYGQNAQGKTNLLEAVWLFTGSKSFRGAKESEYLGFESSHCSLSMDFFAAGRNQEASIAFGNGSNEKRLVRLNGIKQDRLGNLAGEFCSVVFSPDHLSLIKQGPEKRRKMLDTSLCQAYPKYGKALESYHKTLRQRNTLLKDVGQNSQLLDMLDVWDTGLIRYGSYLTALRARYVRKLASHAALFYEGISSGREEYNMRYLSGIGDVPPHPERDELEDLLSKALRAGRGEDIRAGSTGCGPHRDDLEITINGMSARAFGSQGQQRSCILAIKLAECSILEERNGEAPVVMLDDVMSELDSSRRSFLLNQLEGKQVFITCCEANDFSSLQEGKVFQIKAGRLVQS